MARFKPVQKGLLLLPVDLAQQVLPGSFEQALCYLVDHELDLDGLRGRYRNDEQGASAYDPAVLLKIVLLAYSRGLIGSRRIEAACRQHVLFMAVSGDSQPHFTTWPVLLPSWAMRWPSCLPKCCWCATGKA